VDADLANNTLNWQWVAGCGADAAPYFRIFNPVLQSRKFDPQAEYLRRWLPELSGLAIKQMHAPWLATASELHAAGVRLGRDFPQPIVELAKGRAAALEAFQDWRSTLRTA
jgi:deoxyribodipyrimidine photo-lyase